PVPLSALIVLALLGITWQMIRHATAPSPRRGEFIILGTVAACVIAFPLAQMWFFGETDYRRRADAAVVFGARAYADGRASPVLADRVTTACELYRAGLVPKLIFSGG